MPARLLPIAGSSNVAAAGYDEDAQEFSIRFHSGRTYTFLNVPLEVYEEFTEADSKGKFFNERIKDQFAQQ